MFRYPLVLMMVLGAAASAPAGPWGDALFDELHHDFGAVPRGQVATHQFRLTNITKQPLHVADVRVSCGCTAASALQQNLAPGESTVILADMNTGRFAGPRQVTIFVTFDQPQWDEVRLTVRADSREDVLFTPESLAFGRIKQGSGAEATLTISFSGNSQWQVQQARADSGYVQATFQEVRRDANEVAYQVTARVRRDTPLGFWYSNVWLDTNNPALPRTRVPVTVEVVAR